MKAPLLILTCLLTNVLVYAQDFTQTATGFNYQCDVANNADHVWSEIILDCSYSGNGTFGAGDAASNELSLDWGHSSNGYVWITFALVNGTVNLSANPVIKFTARNEVGGIGTPLTYGVYLQNIVVTPGLPPVVTKTDLTDPVTIAATGTNQTFTADFTSLIKGGQNLNAVNAIVFSFNDCAVTQTASSNLKISNFLAGSATLGVKSSIHEDASLKIYPNPTTDKFSVESENVSAGEIVTIKLMDYSGKVIQEAKSTLPYSVDITSFDKGAYMLNIQSTNASTTKKLFKF